MKLLTKEQQKSYQSSKICSIWEKKYEDKPPDDKKYCIKDHWFYTGVYRGAAYVICNLKDTVSKLIF